eukprot:gene6856-6932_t
MSKEESTPGGLLSKVVRFVKNPTVNWTELDSLQDDRESQYSKQMLKEMIERKRRNDFVRRREFDQLRKLRQREVLHGQRVEDAAGRPSFFQSSMASPDERAVTLKKIDEIEAQMSQQWWKSKQGADAPTQPGVMPDSSTEASAEEQARAYAPTVPGSLSAPLDTKPAVQPLFADDSMAIGRFGGTDATMLPGSTPHVEASFSPAAPTAAPAPAFEPEEFVHEPDLEEAAIRFANGDHAGAESGLLEVLAQHQQDDPAQQLEIWMTLFDLYRATGQHDRFDTLAIDFAAQYGRSAPLWFSIPAQLGLAVEVAPAAEPAAAMRRDFSWNAPPTVAVSSVAALQASLARAASPWTLSWSRLASIDEAAVPLLADQFSVWADRDVQIVFSGVEKLHALLDAKTQSGDRSNSPEWWRLRMAAMRLMGKPDEFELVALDYCVTYEVSPPSWVSPRCGYSDNEGVSSGSAPLAADSDFMASDLGESSVPAPLETGPVAQLSGHIDGDATPLLQPFEAHFKPGVPLTIACDKLIRVDFAAAGSVLNWAAEQQGHGHVIQFHNLQRLVAIFFNVIGINEHAWVIPVLRALGNRVSRGWPGCVCGIRPEVGLQNACVRRQTPSGIQVAIGGDGQVTLGNIVVKGTARKVRKLYHGKVLAGFAGATADAFTLFERFEAKLEKHQGHLTRAAIELTKDWRTDRVLRRLEAMLAVADASASLIITGNGDVLEPEQGIVAIGSGGAYAHSAAKALLVNTELSAQEIVKKSLEIAGELCIYTNMNHTIETL